MLRRQIGREGALQAADGQDVPQLARLSLQGRRHGLADKLGLGLEVRIEGPVRQPGLAHDAGKPGCGDAVMPEPFGRDLHDSAARCVLPTLFVAHGFLSVALLHYVRNFTI